MKYLSIFNQSLMKPAAAALLSLSSLLSFLSGATAQSADNTNKVQAGYYRMHLGDMEITALSDGTVPQNFKQLLLNARPGEVEQQLRQNFQADPAELSDNSYLIKTAGKLILIDAGTAGAYGPTLGHVTESLNRAGYKPEQIDAVLITHIHVDHTGGLMNGDQMVFPNAVIYISKPEVDFWFGEGNKSKAPETLKNYFSQAEATVGPYLKAGKVKTFTYGNELLPGITPVASPGHTPGHTFYALESRNQKLLFWGDIIHAAAVQFADPAVAIVYDVNPKAAAAQRMKAFREAAKEGYWVAGDHLSFPGIGHIRAAGTGYTWVPANYSTYPAF